MSSDPRIVARFRREGATLTQLRDPHTVTTYELAEDGETLFIVMELLRGENLQQRYRARGPLPWEMVVAMGRAVCDSLAEAHDRGVVHRDLKPGNIFLVAQPDGSDFVKVLDFGIAKLMSDSSVEGGEQELTKNNEVVGTFEYISPEQIKGSEYTGRSDIYTLGVVMYEMLTGTRPFASVSGPALLVAILTTRPESLAERSPGLPAELDRVIGKCLEPDADDRFQDVRELAAILDILVPPVPTARPPDSLDEATSLLIRNEDADDPPIQPPSPDRAPYATPFAASPVIAPPPGPTVNEIATAIHERPPEVERASQPARRGSVDRVASLAGGLDQPAPRRGSVDQERPSQPAIVRPSTNAEKSQPVQRPSAGGSQPLAQQAPPQQRPSQPATGSQPLAQQPPQFAPQTPQQRPSQPGGSQPLAQQAPQFPPQAPQQRPSQPGGSQPGGSQPLAQQPPQFAPQAPQQRPSQPTTGSQPLAQQAPQFAPQPHAPQPPQRPSTNTPFADPSQPFGQPMHPQQPQQRPATNTPFADPSQPFAQQPQQPQQPQQHYERPSQPAFAPQPQYPQPQPPFGMPGFQPQRQRSSTNSPPFAEQSQPFAQPMPVAQQNAPTIPDRPSFQAPQEPSLYATAPGWPAPVPNQYQRAPTGPVYQYPPQAQQVALPPPPEPASSKLWIVVALAAIIVGVILAVAI